MAETSKSILIIGAGIAGLSAGVYAQLNGYKSRILEMHDLPGGLMTAWKRKGYVIDGCIHWLTGSSKAYPDFYQMWEDIGLIQNREMINPEVFSQIESKDGKVLKLYTNIDRLEQHLLELAPEDSKVITELCSAVRVFTRNMPSAPSSALDAIIHMPKLLPVMPYLRTWGRLTMKEFGEKFSNPFLRNSFSTMWYPEMSAMGLLFTLAMLHNKGAGYPIGGSLPMALAVEKRYCALGGDIEYNARVSKILVEPLPDGKGSRAVGVQLEDGREMRADKIISAADAYATLKRMLDDRFTTPEFQGLFDTGKIFEPVLYVGLGVNRTFSGLEAITAGISIELDEPITVAGKTVNKLETMIYNFDPTLAPEGKTVMNVMIETNYTYWKTLYDDGSDREQYDAEKQKVALEVINRLDRRFPGIASQVEMADVATPVTFERFTGNWQGSFEGWLPTPESVSKPISKTLPGLEDFYMVGQWVQAGGGLPSGVMTGREVLKMICKKDRKKFQVN